MEPEKKPRRCRFWNGRPQHIDFSLDWGPKSDALLKRIIVYTKITTGIYHLQMISVFVLCTIHRKPKIANVLIYAQCSVAMCLHDLSSGNHYHDNSRSVSTDLPETWQWRWMQLGSDGCSWQYICILYVWLIFIYVHEFNMESRCIEFDTVNVCVIIDLYVKNPYDRICAL